MQGVRKSHPAGVECRHTRSVEKPRRHSPTESPRLFEIDPKPLGEELTALGGVPRVGRAFRSLGLPAAIHGPVHIKHRERGYDEGTYVESLVVLKAGGTGEDNTQNQ